MSCRALERHAGYEIILGVESSHTFLAVWNPWPCPVSVSAVSHSLCQPIIASCISKVPLGDVADIVLYREDQKRNASLRECHQAWLRFHLPGRD